LNACTTCPTSRGPSARSRACSRRMGGAFSEPGKGHTIARVGRADARLRRARAGESWSRSSSTCASARIRRRAHQADGYAIPESTSRPRVERLGPSGPAATAVAGSREDLARALELAGAGKRGALFEETIAMAWSASSRARWTTTRLSWRRNPRRVALAGAERRVRERDGHPRDAARSIRCRRGDRGEPVGSDTWRLDQRVGLRPGAAGIQLLDEAGRLNLNRDSGVPRSPRRGARRKVRAAATLRRPRTGPLPAQVDSSWKA